ncbi:structural contituent of cuticle [Holotrichia oblita]|uniref:Structural contituent of cuticle n=2 Tax=Holotrichia oblita TaxID=644536 RepID=A0ACB9TNH0_HOLOL|nr:structural contituent of cuticle [Holotrichia oblita]KAI4468354.1 structural contituent of cuticle [Holotrichia oblita]
MNSVLQIATSTALLFALVKAGYIGGGELGGSYAGLDGGYNGGGDAYGGYGGGDDSGKDYNAYPKYNFNYAVNDPHTGDEKQHSEERDGDHVRGTYSVKEADGTTRIVEYQADGHNGFNAVVHKVGTPTHGGGTGGYGGVSGYGDSGHY